MTLYDVKANIERSVITTYYNIPLPLQGVICAADEEEAEAYLDEYDGTHFEYYYYEDDYCDDKKEYIFEYSDPCNAERKIRDRYTDIQFIPLCIANSTTGEYFYNVLGKLKRTMTIDIDDFQFTNQLFEGEDYDEAIEQAEIWLMNRPEYKDCDDSGDVCLEYKCVNNAVYIDKYISFNPIPFSYEGGYDEDDEDDYDEDDDDEDDDDEDDDDEDDDDEDDDDEDDDDEDDDDEDDDDEDDDDEDDDDEDDDDEDDDQPGNNISNIGKPVFEGNNFKVFDDCGCIDENAGEWVKYLRIVDWYSNGPKYDLRVWNKYDNTPSNGLTMSKTELKRLFEEIEYIWDDIDEWVEDHDPIKIYERKNSTYKPVALIRDIAEISDDNNSEYIEFNIISWNNNEPKYDIRKWANRENPYQTHGITLNADELRQLCNILEDIVGYEDESDLDEIPF